MARIPKPKNTAARPLPKRFRSAASASPDRDETMKYGFAGNTVQAKVKVADGAGRPWDLDTKFQLVGTKIQRFDGIAKATGRAKYAYDMNLPGLLHARILCAPIAAGTLTELEISPLDEMKSVKGTHQFKKVGDRILFAGQSVIAVAAETPEAAEDGIRAIVATYESAPHVVTIEDAMKEGAPQVLQNRPNVGEGQASGVKEEEIDATLKEAAATVDATYRTQVQTHSALETHGGVAWFQKDASGEEKLTVWASTQGTFSVLGDLRQRFNLKSSQVEVICEYMGGGFGAKFGADEAIVAAAELSKKTGLPVKCMRTRKEEHLATGNRPNSIQHVKAGASKDGKLLCWQVDILGTGGSTRAPARETQ